MNTHVHGDGQGGSLGQPAPCLLFVGDQPISEADIAHEMQFHPAARPERSRADAARALVVRELLRREAERVGLAPASVQVGREGVEEAAIRMLLEHQVESRVPDEEDCRRYFEQNPERFRAPSRMRIRHILLPAPADDPEARLHARRLADELIAGLRANPALFADFALRHSACPSKDTDGDMGWLQCGQATPEFDRQVFRLREGLAAFPVESRWGYHVVRIDGIAGGEPLPFDEVRGRISDYLELQVRQQALQLYLQQLEQHYGVRGLDAIEALADASATVS